MFWPTLLRHGLLATCAVEWHREGALGDEWTAGGCSHAFGKATDIFRLKLFKIQGQLVLW